MNLLIVNFETDEGHGALAWQARVVQELARHCEKVVVVTSRIGEFQKPDNVVLFTVPARPLHIPQRFGGNWAVNWHVYELCKQHAIDAVFVHMAMEWSYRLFPAFRLLRLPVVMWYAHVTVTTRLKWAVKCADLVVTSTPGGCRIDSPKVNIIGQGIDTDLFDVRTRRNPTNIIHIGRITERKRISLLVDVASELKKRNPGNDMKMRLIGPVLTAQDIRYDWAIRNRVLEEGLDDTVDLVGYVPLRYLPRFYDDTFLHLNVCDTESVEKSLVEALACGCPVLTNNPAFASMFSDFPEFVLKDLRPQAIAEQVEYIRGRWDQYDPQRIRQMVEGRHDLKSYALRLLEKIRQAQTGKGSVSGRISHSTGSHP